MNEKSITVFDTIFSTDLCKIYKILFPYVPEKYQPFFALFIKFQELLYITAFFERKHLSYGENLKPNLKQDSVIDHILEIGKQILPFCPPEYSDLIKEMISLLEKLKTLQNLSPLLDFMNSQNNNGETSSCNDGFSFLKSMMNAGDADLMNQFESLFEDS